MNKIKKILLIGLVAAISSCTTIENDKNKDVTDVDFNLKTYPSMFSPVSYDLASNHISDAIAANNKIANIKQLSTLNDLESGRLSQLNDDFDTSIQDYDKAIKTISTSDEQSRAQAKAIVSDLNTYSYYNIKSAYNIPDYSATFLYTYQALNYLNSGSIDKAIDILNNMPNAKFWTDQQSLIANTMLDLAKKDIAANDIVIGNLGIDKYEDLNSMVRSTNIIPNAYGNPFGYYLKAILEGSKGEYQNALDSIGKAQEYTRGNKYIQQTAVEFNNAIMSNTSPFSMGMGRLVVFYEHGLVMPRNDVQLPMDLGDIGDVKVNLPIYRTKYPFNGPKKISIKSNDKTIDDSSTETLMDTTLFATKSLVNDYFRIITQNVVIEALKADYGKKDFAMGGLLGSHLKFGVSDEFPKRADLRSWLLLPNSTDLYEHQLDSGSYNVDINNISQKIDIKQGKTTLLWIIDIGAFKKIYYFIM